MEVGLCVKIHLHIQKEHRQTMAARGAKANPGSQQTIEVHLHKPRGVQRSKVMWEHKLKAQGIDTMSGYLPGLSHETLSPVTC